MDHKVSVIIPVYNREKFVRECVESILAQTHENFEIILIDDGSTDQTLTICRELAEQDARIRVLEEQHGGVSAARNVGIEAATGEFIFFVDSDDVINPHLMDALVRGMTNSGAGISGTRVVGVNEQRWHMVRERLERPFDPGVTEKQTNDQAVEAMFTGGSPLACIGGVMMRRDLIGQTRFRTDLFIGEDFFFIYENLIKGADVDFLKQNWYYVRNHENNSSWNYGYDGFYTRFLRRKLVWESEESLGRTEYARRQKQEVLSIFNRCLNKQETTKEDRRKMRETMKRHRKELVPAYTVKQRVLYYLSAYAPNFVRAAFLQTLTHRGHHVRQKAQQQQRETALKQQDKEKGNVALDNPPNSKNYELVKRFLSMSVSAGDGVFSAFEALPGAVSGRGNTDLERYVYIPGTRKDRIVLVAHADTVWDAAYGLTSSGTDLAFKDGVFYSKNPEQGIGADDRAGCAMLYALRGSGHSLLLVNGEERGKKGAHWLRNNKKLFDEINRHAFMIELDWCGTNSCLFNQVDNSNKFKKYIEQQLGFHDSHKKGGTDLQVLCHKVCGVNIGVGYHNPHSSRETLDLREWENTYCAMTTFLEKEHARFPIDKRRRLVSNAKWLRVAVKSKLKRLLTHK